MRTKTTCSLDFANSLKAETIPYLAGRNVGLVDEVEDRVCVALVEKWFSGMLFDDKQAEDNVTSFGAYSRYASPICFPQPFPREAWVVRNPPLHTWELRPNYTSQYVHTVLVYGPKHGA